VVWRNRIPVGTADFSKRFNNRWDDATPTPRHRPLLEMLLKGSLAEIYGRENLKNPPVEQSQNALCLLNLWASFPTDWDNMLCLRSISKLGDLADCNQCSKGL